jgi:hypothetical protein
VKRDSRAARTANGTIVCQQPAEYCVTQTIARRKELPPSPDFPGQVQYGSLDNDSIGSWPINTNLPPSAQPSHWMLSDFTSAQLDIHGISIPPNDLPPDGQTEIKAHIPCIIA